MSNYSDRGIEQAISQMLSDGSTKTIKQMAKWLHGEYFTTEQFMQFVFVVIKLRNRGVLQREPYTGFQESSVPAEYSLRKW